MATEHSTKPMPLRLHIAQFQWANAMMRAANRALARGDEAALARIGFSAEHVDELRQSGGFPERVFRANYRTIAFLRRHGGRHAH
ncbi:hypothetical protein [Ralstonia pseudosolanacearum]|uniref:hypothetical protein n=1 Tax=Ralstonia pseudosolanacearum TaxID=1310165 RepID=UPI001BB05434|nr:hypothetical protein [Ralstonia pseudosolanacearum]